MSPPYSTPPSSTPASAGSVLLVEDDHTLQDALTRRLIRRGFDVTPVSHPRQALGAAAHHPYDVAIIDQLLPETNGIALMKLLRGCHGTLKVILLSGGGSDSPEDAAIAEGAFAHLKRRCRIHTLAGTVSDAMSHLGPDEPRGPTAC